MQIYRTFLKMLMRNIASGLMYLGIFIGISISVAKSNESNDYMSYETTKVNVSVIDKDNSTLSRSLYNYLNESHKIVDIDSDEEKWADELFYRTVDYILVIEKGFEDNMSQENYEDLLTSYSAPDSNASYIVESQVESYMQNISIYVNSGFDFEEAAQKAADVSKISADVLLPDNSNAAEKVSAASYFFTFFPYVLLCMLINSLGATLIAWNKTEIKARTAVSGTSLTERNMGILGAMLVYSLIIAGIFILVCTILYKDDFFTESSIYYGLNCLCYMFVCMAITFLVAQLSKKLAALSIWSNVLGLSTSFLCGVFVSRDLLPDKVVAFSRCLPTYWYINVTEELKHFRGSISSSVWISMGVQLLFAAAILSVTLVIIKSRQQKNT